MCMLYTNNYGIQKILSIKNHIESVVYEKLIIPRLQWPKCFDKHNQDEEIDLKESMYNSNRNSDKKKKLGLNGQNVYQDFQYFNL